MKKDGKILADKASAEGVYTLIPTKHPTAWKIFEDSVGNGWTPKEAPMVIDKQQWPTANESDKLLVKKFMGLTVAAESIVANNLLTVVQMNVEDPECCQYIARQMYEELIHNWTVADVTASFDLDLEEIYEAFVTVPEVKAYSDFILERTSDFTNMIFDHNPLVRDFQANLKEAGHSDEDIIELSKAFSKTLKGSSIDISTRKGKQDFLHDLIVFYILTEGILFFSCFAMVLSMRPRNLFPGLTKQIEYTMRDETLHVKFGTYLINKIREQNPTVWTKEFNTRIEDTLTKGLELIQAFVLSCIPEGLLGLGHEDMIKYIQYLANLRFSGIGIDNIKFPQTEHPLPWLTEAIEQRNEENFFEGRVTAYQDKGNLIDDL